MTSEKEDFKVVIASKADEDTIVLTSEGQSQQWIEQAFFNFNNNYHQYSSYLTESSLGKTPISNDTIDDLADNPQGNLEKVKKINAYARYFINKDDLIGKVYETIESNINTDIKLSYRDFSSNRNKQKLLEKVKVIINDFNKQISIRNLLRKSIPLAYSEGNYPMYLRKNCGGSYVVDHYPLGVVEVSDYDIDGEPCLLMNINELKSRLQKINKKTKKGKSLFFNNAADEINSAYPPEVGEAYANKESYTKLDIKHSGILRVNNMGRKYGVTPIFRTFESAMMLTTFEKTDRVNAKAKGKKIIFQKLHKEILGKDFDKQGFEQMAYAHDSLMRAWKNETVMYTGAPFVEDIKYIEPNVENININNVNYYRSKIMTALGIGFLNQDSKQTFTVANISIRELMKTINKISEQLEDVLEKWYKVVLQENNIPIEFCPTIEVIDSEQLESEIKFKLAEILFSKMNASYSTVFSILGVDLEDEKQKRAQENSEGLDEVFKPRLTAYTNSSKSSGRPIDNNDPDKQLEDQNRRGSE
ncbi:hypothetical protein BRE01_62230 [Brevibacillus reuszeri]|uniref:Portal protein n=2 Tax=Brevibacillus reuszeri TaxID=54915 RepID=A0A0K9YW74_9BACL|nr:hypothetical protein [Brevibacillus reuszeri]KNB72921.1 hypothetical protein ADS79_13925 [Brevibacillus reuszeri]GED72521.1 hypothetical protein BRE01_62230 [Brevibacillus reuszeri]